MAEAQKEHARSNLLLGALETSSRERIDPHLEPITLKLGVHRLRGGGLLKHAYFPEGAVLSLLTVLENGSAIETANIKREGAFGLFAAMYSRFSLNRCLVQLEGSTLSDRIVAIGINVILCAISTAAMDDLEGRRGEKPEEHVDQFMRLREVIEERVSRKCFEEEFQVDRPVGGGLMISHDSRFYDSHHSPALRAAAVVRMRRGGTHRVPQRDRAAACARSRGESSSGQSASQAGSNHEVTFSYWKEVSSMS
jgi:Protein of unknown function (DUF1488)